ncbi:MAG: hypothetical protein R2751_16855 [Bacteroidales bacterium]
MAVAILFVVSAFATTAISTNRLYGHLQKKFLSGHQSGPNVHASTRLCGP